MSVSRSKNVFPISVIFLQHGLNIALRGNAANTGLSDEI
jgi:hypothetical protein